MGTKSWDLGINEELEKVERRMKELVSSSQRLLTDISLHVIDAGGKRLRPTLSILSHHALHGNDLVRLIDISAAMELIHSATLVHDDINDGAEMRRGKKAAYRKYGLHEAIVTGDFLFARAFYIGGTFGKKIVELVAESTTHVAEGEMMQYAHRKDPKLSVDQYLKIIEGKTAYPIRTAAQLGVCLAEGSSEDLRNFGEYGLNLGIAFQIVDDILDINGNEQNLGKMIGSDLREGNLTLPVILARDHDKEIGKHIREFMKDEKPDEKKITDCLEMVRKSGAIKNSLEIAKGYAEGAKEYIEHVSASKYHERLMELTELVINRAT
ncbi:MAG: polyprenyl synthetase family protein [Thermoplasmata archaeon]|nr:polyprenyl synthetase family protein [Thermoplasmata archaeon]